MQDHLLILATHTSAWTHQTLRCMRGMGAQVNVTVSKRNGFRPQTSDRAPISGALRKDNIPCNKRPISGQFDSHTMPASNSNAHSQGKQDDTDNDISDRQDDTDNNVNNSVTLRNNTVPCNSLVTNWNEIVQLHCSRM